jgi:predicted ribosome quality control (RQC) complex YloA/Tae2 family protein
VSPAVNILSFPSSVERARKNSVDLFPGVIGHRVMGIRQFRNERSFAVELEDEKVLLFKMHGSRSNVLLFENAHVTELFRNNLPADADLDLKTLDRDIDWSHEAFMAHQNAPEKHYFTFGKVVWIYLDHHGFYSAAPDQKWTLIRDVLRQLDQPSFYVTELKNSLHLTLLPFENSSELKGDLIEISNRFFHAFTQEYVLEKEKSAAVGTLKARLSGSLNYYEKNFQKLTEIESDTNYKHWADLIMANMHLIEQGMEKVSLNDFYQDDHQVEIKLKKPLSPQANAAVYYRKAKNQHIEIERLQQSLQQKEKEIEALKQTIQEVSAIADLKELRKKVQAAGMKSEKQKDSSPVPYHEFMVGGYRIWVGKNAESNDLLTLKYTYKEDLWLHAKDVAGSHVVIKYQSGKNYPKDVIERAAQLAAYNSRRKTESLCPVVVTPKKFVRKRKGDPAGMVVVERESVILVEPRL